MSSDLPHQCWPATPARGAGSQLLDALEGHVDEISLVLALAFATRYRTLS